MPTNALDFAPHRASEETAVTVSHEPAGDPKALCVVDQNILRIAALMDPYNPKLREPLTQDSLAKNLNGAVIGGKLPASLGFPFNNTSGPALLKKISISMRFHRMAQDFPNFPKATEAQIRTLADQLSMGNNPVVQTPWVSTPAGLQKSPNCRQFPYTIQNSLNLAEELPHEEFPACSIGDGKKFEIITDNGERHLARVDFTAEDTRWNILSSETLDQWESVGKQKVIAWQEV